MSINNLAKNEYQISEGSSNTARVATKSNNEYKNVKTEKTKMATLYPSDVL